MNPSDPGAPPPRRRPDLGGLDLREPPAPGEPERDPDDEMYGYVIFVRWELQGLKFVSRVHQSPTMRKRYWQMLADTVNKIADLEEARLAPKIAESLERSAQLPSPPEDPTKK